MSKADEFPQKTHFLRPQILHTTGCQRGRGLSDDKKPTATASAAAAFLSHSRMNQVRLIYGRGEWT
jgi:hypothetical protein